MKTLIVLYLAFFNVLAFTLMYADKRFAQRRLRRIPESVLMMSAGLGGSVGSWLGMYAFHHKTRKPRFFIGIPAVFVLQVGMAVGLALWCYR